MITKYHRSSTGELSKIHVEVPAGPESRNQIKFLFSYNWLQRAWFITRWYYVVGHGSLRAGAVSKPHNWKEIRQQAEAEVAQFCLENPTERETAKL